MTTFKDQPRTVTLVADLRVQDITETGDRDNYNFCGEWIQVYSAITEGIVRKKGAIVLNKKGFPVDASATGQDIDFVIEGQMDDGDDPVEIDTFAYSDFSGGDSLNDVVDLWPRMRVRVTGYAAGTDTESTSVEADQKTIGIVPRGFTEITGTQGHEESFLFIPRVLPPEGTVTGGRSRAKRRLYPVVVTVGTRATAGNYYNGGWAYDSGGYTNDNLGITTAAIRKGFAVLGVDTLGINSLQSTGPNVFCHWQTTPFTNTALSEPSRYTPQTDVMWAIQWVRENWEEYNLDPNRILLQGEFDGAALALWGAYGNLENAQSLATQRQLRHSTVPNLVAAIKPDIDWGVMADALRCPLQGSADGTSATTLANANGTQRALLPVNRLLNSTVYSDTYRRKKAQIPYYIGIDNSVAGKDEDISADTSAGSPNFTNWLPTEDGNGTIDASLSPWHGYNFKAAVQYMCSETLGSTELPIYQASKLKLMGGTSSTVAANAALEDGDDGDLDGAYDGILEWAKDYWKVYPTECLNEGVFHVRLAF